MDYSKSGAAKAGQNRPKHAEHNQKGGPKNPFGQDNASNALIERMKAAAAARKAGTDADTDESGKA